MKEVFKRKNKIVGILEYGIFRKSVDMKKHFMRKFNGFGIDLETFKKLPNDTQIMILDETNKKIYCTDWQTYADNGVVEPDFGYGWQIFLDKNKFNESQEKTIQS